MIMHHSFRSVNPQHPPLKSIDCGSGWRYVIGLGSSHWIALHATSDGGALRREPRRFWISPNPDRSDYKNDPPPSDGSKVIVLDTDHLWGVGGNVTWVWKSFLRGYNPIWMDPLDKVSVWEPTPANAEAVRSNLGYARRFTERTKLAGLKPSGALASSGYCLANPSREYLIYLPDGGEVTVDLSSAAGELAVEWFAPVTDSITQANTIKGGASTILKAPFKGHAVLHLVASKPR